MVNTGPQRPESCSHRNQLSLAMAGCFLVVLLVGCASGSAEDSRRFEYQEAEQEQVLPGAQATQLAEHFASPTSSPEPSVTPRPRISELALASSVSGDGSPNGTIRSVSAYGTQTVYAVARISNIQPGQVVTAAWRNKDGTVILSSEIAPQPSASPQWISFPVQFGQVLSPGTYSVAIFVGNDLLESLVFQAS